MPFINLSDHEIVIQNDELIARAWPCVPDETSTEKVLKVDAKDLPELSLDQVKYGPIDDHERDQLFQLIQEYRYCFSQGYTDLGCVQTGDEMTIQHSEEKPFTYLPTYRMSQSDKEKMSSILKEPLQNSII